MPSTPIISDVAGLRVGHLLPTERIGTGCIRCNRFHTHKVVDLQRGFQPFYPAWWLVEAMSVFCIARRTGQGECGLWIISPDDGCSDAG